METTPTHTPCRKGDTAANAPSPRKLTFALFGNIHQPKKSRPVQTLLTLLHQRGADVLIDRHFHDYLTHTLALSWAGSSLPLGIIDGIDFEADTVISMGGDGTFLEVAARVRDKGIPILGINTGHLGFLADVPPDNIPEAVQDIYDGRCVVEPHSLLRLDFQGPQSSLPNGAPPYPFALNEVAVLKRDNSSMISIRVDINGEYLTTYQADGLILSTPTGSTGYALSAGGPIMSPRCGGVLLTAVAPHSLNVRPIALPDDVVVSLTVHSRSHHFLVAIDGRSHDCAEGVTLTLRRADYQINVLKRPASTFFRTIRDKLNLGAATEHT